MIDTERKWPTLNNYDTALGNTDENVLDPDIKRTKLRVRGTIMRLNTFKDKYVSVYPMDNQASNTTWVVRCFFTNGPNLAPPSDIQERYLTINEYVAAHQSQLPFLVHQQWVSRAVRINGQDWPFIKSRLLPAAQKLGEFLEDYHQEKYLVAALAKQFLEMVNVLETLTIAHGDLDITNILVCGTFPNIALRLVDFDCMYVPGLTGKKLHEEGHEHFQPVHRGVRQFDAHMDRFSALIIYLSLLALAEDPSLWSRCKANEENKLLLGEKDFENLAASFAYKELRKQNNSLLQKYLQELDYSIKDHRMPEALHTIGSANFIPRELKPLHAPSPGPSFWIPKYHSSVAPDAWSTPAPLPKVGTPKYSFSIPKTRLSNMPLDDKQISPMPPAFPNIEMPKAQTPQPPTYDASQAHHQSYRPPIFYDREPPKTTTPTPRMYDGHQSQPQPYKPRAFDDIEPPKTPPPPPAAYHNTQQQPQHAIPQAFDGIEPPKPSPPPLPVYHSIQQQPQPYTPQAFDVIEPLKQPAPQLPIYRDVRPQPKPYIPPVYDDVDQQQPQQPYVPPAYRGTPETQPTPYSPQHYDSPTQPDSQQRQQQQHVLSPNMPSQPLNPTVPRLSMWSWLLLIGIILTFILAFVTSWIWFILTIIFLVMFLAFPKKRM